MKNRSKRAMRGLEIALLPGGLKAQEDLAKADDDLTLQQARMGLLDQRMEAGRAASAERANFAATRGAPSGVNKRNTRDYVSRGAFTSIGKLENANLAKQESMLKQTGDLMKDRRKAAFGSLAGFAAQVNTPEFIRSQAGR